MKLGVSSLRHPVYTSYTLATHRNNFMPDIEDCIRHGADWLLRAQQNSPDGAGYSRRFSLAFGWDRSYIETTGYIIPTLLDVADYLGESKYRESAYLAADWLLSVQASEGEFTDINSYIPQVFDTGQVLLGLNRMYRETRDERFLKSARKAARWLVKIQDGDGAWRRYSFNDRPHAYYSRVAAALIETGQLDNNEEYIDAGARNLNWVIAQELANGYFRYSEFRPGEDALLHTIVYVLEGFSIAFNLTGERQWKDAMMRGVSVLKDLVDANGLLNSQYNDKWEITNSEYCVTGLAQYAGICFDVFRINEDTEYFSLGNDMLTRLCRWQLTKGNDVHGALPSSIPVWGYYGGMDFYNWNIKFFLDVAIKLLLTEKRNSQFGD